MNFAEKVFSFSRFRSGSAKQADGAITPELQADQTMSLEGARDAISKKEKALYEREHRLEEKEKVVAQRERHLEEEERRKAAEWVDIERRATLEKDYRQEIDRLRREGSTAKNEAKAAIDRLNLSADGVAKLEKELREVREQMRQSQGLVASLEEKLHHREKDMRVVQDRSLRMEMEYSRTRALLETCTLELKGAQSFLSTADSLAGADASSMAESLNAEILQAAAFITDSFEFERVKTNPGEALIIARDRTKNILGLTMLELLSSIRHCEDPLIVQIALQACMTQFASWVIAGWHLDSSKDQSLLWMIYSEMREVEDQAVAGRWRALTRIYARQALNSESDVSSSLRSMIVECLSHILLTAGCTTDPLRIQEVVCSKFCDRMSTLLGLTARLHQALGEEIISGDLEVIWIPSDHTFDPATMDDIGGQDQKTGHVLCTTDLGMQRLVRTGTIGDERGWQITNLLKTKVALKSVTEGMGVYDSGDL